MKRKQLDTFVQKYGPMVFRRAKWLLGNESDAEDAVQEVFVRALKNLDRFDGRGELSTWLYRITTNFCLNVLRDRRRRQRLLEQRVVGATPTCTKPSPFCDMIQAHRLLASAPEPKWSAAVIYVYVDGMSHHEAAQLLNVSKRTVRNFLQRFSRWAAHHCGEAHAESIAA